MTTVPQNSLVTNFLQNIFLLCSAERRHSYRFGTTWGWVNETIFIFGWTIPLKVMNRPSVGLNRHTLDKNIWTSIKVILWVTYITLQKDSFWMKPLPCSYRTPSWMPVTVAVGSTPSVSLWTEIQASIPARKSAREVWTIWTSFGK